MVRLRNIFSVVIFYLTACQQPAATTMLERPDSLANALAWAGPRKAELQKALHHYNRPQDRLKHQAVAYLISGLPYQTYTEIADTAALTRIVARIREQGDFDARLAYLTDSLGALANRSPAFIKRDVDVIDAAFLIENVELAFEAWQKPWARTLSFADFCRYVLPYKSLGEKPTYLRRALTRQYSPWCDTVRTPTSRRAVCAVVCQQLSNEYRYVGTMPTLGTAAIVRCKMGTCFELTQLTGDVMRALGLPVTHEACSWGNYDGGHTWNALYENHQFVPFSFTDASPGTGDFKCELTVAEANDHWRRRRSKVWRNQYLPGVACQAADLPLQEDLTASILPCSDVALSLAVGVPAVGVPIDGPIYLCTFSNRTWKPISQGERSDARVLFRQMGRGLCYLPAQVDALQSLLPVGPPFILDQDGRVIPLAGRAENRAAVRLTAKFPIGGSNKIKVGDRYRLAFWRDGWQPLGFQTATARTLNFTNVPSDAVLWLQDIDRGHEERIFTYENDRQVWW